MPKYYVTYEKTYVINAVDDIEAIDNAWFNGEQVHSEIFIEEVSDE